MKAKMRREGGEGLVLHVAVRIQSKGDDHDLVNSRGGSAEKSGSAPETSEPLRKLWEAATVHWEGEGDDLAAELADSATAMAGEPIRGKDLYRIGVELGLIEEMGRDA